MELGLIAMFELTEQEGRVVVLDERHYQLVSAEELTADELRAYSAKQ
jgi:hypothetical protein